MKDLSWSKLGQDESKPLEKSIPALESHIHIRTHPHTCLHKNIQEGGKEHTYYIRIRDSGLLNWSTELGYRREHTYSRTETNTKGT